MKQLGGKVAIITGANQGLGLQIANHYINNGANIAICARNKSKLFNVKKHLKKIFQITKKFLLQNVMFRTMKK